MAQGRCPGCGEIGSSKAINSHVSGCPAYAERFAAGDVLLSPEAEFRVHAVERVAPAVPRASRAPRPEMSDPPATVPDAPAPKRASRPLEPVVVPERTAGPVNVEYWDLPHSL